MQYVFSYVPHTTHVLLRDDGPNLVLPGGPLQDGETPESAAEQYLLFQARVKSQGASVAGEIHTPQVM